MAEQLRDEAQELAEAGDLSLALATINQSLSLNPNDAEALATRSELLLWAENDIDGAIADLEAAIALEPEEYGHYFGLTFKFYVVGRDGEALQALNTALELGAGEEDFFNLRALIRAKDDAQLANAESDARTAVTISDGGFAAADTLAYVLLRRGKLAEALEIYQALDPDGESFYTTLGRGLTMWQLGQEEAARPVLILGMQLLRQEVNYNVYVTWDPQANNLAGQAMARVGDEEVLAVVEIIGAGDLEIALERLQAMQTWAIAEFLFFANSTAGHILARFGEHQLAIDNYSLAIEFLPQSFLHHARANSYYELGDLEAARADLDDGLELDESHQDSIALRALVLQELGEYEAALADARIAAAAAPDDLSLRIRLVDSLMYMRQYDEALAEVEDFAPIASSDDAVYAVRETRGLVLLGLRRFEDAIAEADAAEPLDPQPWSAHLIRAIAHAELGETDLASDYFDSAQAAGAGEVTLDWFLDLANLN